MAGGAGWLFWWWSAVSGAWACDAELLTLTRSDLGSAKSADFKLRKLAGSLAESCSFVPALADALAIVPSIELASRPKLEQKVVVSEPAAWTTACAGGMPAFEAAFAQTGADRAHSLYGACDVARFKFATESELAGATGFVFLSILVGEHFEEKRIPDTLTIPLLRGLAGITGAPPTAPAPPADPSAAARDRVALIAGKPFEALPAAEWATHASALLPLCETLRTRPVAERMKSRQLEFDTCAQAGRAAENAGGQVPPYFRPLNGTTANWGYYLAGAVAKGDPTLVSLCKDETIKGAVGWYLQQVTSGALPTP